MRSGWGLGCGISREGSLIQGGESELQDQFVLGAPFGVFEARSSLSALYGPSAEGYICLTVLSPSGQI